MRSQNKGALIQGNKRGRSGKSNEEYPVPNHPLPQNTPLLHCLKLNDQTDTLIKNANAEETQAISMYIKLFHATSASNSLLL